MYKLHNKLYVLQRLTLFNNRNAYCAIPSYPVSVRRELRLYASAFSITFLRSMTLEKNGM